MKTYVKKYGNEATALLLDTFTFSWLKSGDI